MIRKRRKCEKANMPLLNGMKNAMTGGRHPTVPFLVLGAILGPIIAYACGGMALTAVVAAVFLATVILLRPAVLPQAWLEYRLRHFALSLWASAFASSVTLDLWVWPMAVETARTYGIGLPTGSQLYLNVVCFAVFGIILIVLCRANRH
jgi:hypothetical protein